MLQVTVNWHELRKDAGVGCDDVPPMTQHEVPWEATVGDVVTQCTTQHPFWKDKLGLAATDTGMLEPPPLAHQQPLSPLMIGTTDVPLLAFNTRSGWVKSKSTLSGSYGDSGGPSQQSMEQPPRPQQQLQEWVTDMIPVIVPGLVTCCRLLWRAVEADRQ